jgi:hypothetical protein
MIKLTLVCGLVAVALAGCGGGSTNSLTSGVYENEVTAEYLTDNGFTADHAARDSGDHVITLTNGSLTDSWTNGDNEKAFCTGTYEDQDSSITVTWISGCFGDWSASYAIDGDTVTWSDVRALPPHDSAEDQRQTEVFATPWTRTADASDS